MIAARGRAVVAALAVFVVAAVAYAAVGLTVSHTPPAGVDAAARGVAGEAPGLAWVLTESCLWPVLTSFGMAGLIVAFFAPLWRGRITFAILITIVGWQTSNVLKDIFRRPRPGYWILHQETSFAYSSGHAMFAVIVYWLWAWYVARSNLPLAVRAVLAPLLALWGAGVIWSRLALGAHYPTDLAGGMLLGAALLALGTLVAGVVAPRARIA